MVDRLHFITTDIIADIWKSLDLPKQALESLQLDGSGLGLPSSFKVGPLAQASIAFSALAASLVYATRNEPRETREARNIASYRPEYPLLPKVTISLRHACAEFKSERLYLLNGK